jgi:hypothetical protein
LTKKEKPLRQKAAKNPFHTRRKRKSLLLLEHFHFPLGAAAASVIFEIYSHLLISVAAAAFLCKRES